MEWARDRYASSTLRNRSLLWTRFVQYCTRNLTTPAPANAVLFLASMAGEVKSSTLSGYAGSLNAVGRSFSLSWDLAPLRDLASLVRGLPSEPAVQAVPATKDQLWSAFRFLKEAGKFECAYILLFCWKAAARLSDVLHLFSEDVLVVSTVEGPSLLVDWKRSKARVADPFCDTRFSLLGGPGVMELGVFLRVLALQRLPNRPLFRNSSKSVIAALRSVPSCEALSGHSMKRGALQFLLVVSSRGVRVSPDDLRRFARHRAPCELLPGVTIRYLAEASLLLAEFLSLRRLSVLL